MSKQDRKHLDDMLQEMEEQRRLKEEHKARTPEPECKDWPFQKEIDLLVKSKFAIIDFKATASWKEKAWMDSLPIYHTCYEWTLAGKTACWRYEYSTPMAWAQEMHNGSGRHCVVCGRDCYRKRVWASSGRMRCVCMECGGKGHGLQDLAQNEQEQQEAVEIEQHLSAMDVSARRQAREIKGK